MLSLYHAPDSRSSRFIWLLEEIGAEYEIVYCDIQRRSGRGAPDVRNPHPEKRVPALSHDGVVVTEQAAIALYLTDAFPTAGLGAAVGDAARAPYLSWLAFYAGEIDPLYTTRSLYHERLDPMTVRDHQRVAQRVIAALAKGPFLLGDKFSAADISSGTQISRTKPRPSETGLAVWPNDRPLCLQEAWMHRLRRADQGRTRPFAPFVTEHVTNAQLLK